MVNDFITKNLSETAQNELALDILKTLLVNMLIKMVKLKEKLTKFLLETFKMEFLQM